MDTEGLEDSQKQAGGNRRHTVAQTTQDGDGKALDGQSRAAVILGVGNRRDHAAGQGADSGAEHERQSDHIFGIDAA